MDILRRGGLVAISIPEDLGDFCRIAAGVFISDSIVCRCGLVAVCVHVVGYRFVGDPGSIADGGVVPAILIFPFGHGLRIADGQIAFIIVISGSAMVQAHRICCRNKGIRRQAEANGQGQSHQSFRNAEIR